MMLGDTLLNTANYLDQRSAEAIDYFVEFDANYDWIVNDHKLRQKDLKLAIRKRTLTVLEYVLNVDTLSAVRHPNRLILKDDTGLCVTIENLDPIAKTLEGNNEEDELIEAQEAASDLKYNRFRNLRHCVEQTSPEELAHILTPSLSAELNNRAYALDINFYNDSLQANEDGSFAANTKVIFSNGKILQITIHGTGIDNPVPEMKSIDHCRHETLRGVDALIEFNEKCDATLYCLELDSIGDGWGSYEQLYDIEDGQTESQQALSALINNITDDTLITVNDGAPARADEIITFCVGVACIDGFPLDDSGDHQTTSRGLFYIAAQSGRNYLKVNTRPQLAKAA